jgi:hypothetical protein
MFDNLEKGDDDELVEDNLMQTNNNGFANVRAPAGGGNRIPVPDILPPLSGGFGNSAATCAMQPLAGVTLPEHSLQLLGSFC